MKAIDSLLTQTLAHLKGFVAGSLKPFQEPFTPPSVSHSVRSTVWQSAAVQHVEAMPSMETTFPDVARPRRHFRPSAKFLTIF